MMDLFAGTNVNVILLNRVYVSMLGIEVPYNNPKCWANDRQESALNHGLMFMLPNF